jgi:hypothetical protein
VAGRGTIRVWFWVVCFGSWVPARTLSCPENIRLTRPATSVFSSGCARASWSRCSAGLVKHLHERGKLNLEEAFVDATFASRNLGWDRPREK